MIQLRYLLDMAVSLLTPQLDHNHQATHHFQVAPSKFDEGTTRITSRVTSGSARRTPRVNCMSPSRRTRGDIETSIERLGRINRLRRTFRWGRVHFDRVPTGGGVSGERVVVAMLPLSLDLFLDLVEGRTVDFSRQVYQINYNIVLFKVRMLNPQGTILIKMFCYRTH